MIADTRLVQPKPASTHLVTRLWKREHVSEAFDRRNILDELAHEFGDRVGAASTCVAKRSDSSCRVCATWYVDSNEVHTCADTPVTNSNRSAVSALNVAVPSTIWLTCFVDRPVRLANSAWLIPRSLRTSSRVSPGGIA
jgi:hypothetical protein